MYKIYTTLDLFFVLPSPCCDRCHTMIAQRVIQRGRSRLLVGSQVNPQYVRPMRTEMPNRPDAALFGSSPFLCIFHHPRVSLVYISHYNHTYALLLSFSSAVRRDDIEQGKFKQRSRSKTGFKRVGNPEIKRHARARARARMEHAPRATVFNSLCLLIYLWRSKDTSNILFQSMAHQTHSNIGLRGASAFFLKHRSISRKQSHIHVCLSNRSTTISLHCYQPASPYYRVPNNQQKQEKRFCSTSLYPLFILAGCW